MSNNFKQAIKKRGKEAIELATNTHCPVLFATPSTTKERNKAFTPSR